MLVKAIKPCFVAGALRKPGAPPFEYEGKLGKCMVPADEEVKEEPSQLPETGPTKKAIMLELDMAGVKYNVADKKEVLAAQLADYKKSINPALSPTPSRLDITEV